MLNEIPKVNDIIEGSNCLLNSIPDTSTDFFRVITIKNSSPRHCELEIVRMTDKKTLIANLTIGQSNWRIVKHGIKIKTICPHCK